MAKDYLINEGNQIGYMDSSFDTGLNLVQKKLVAGADIQKGQVVYVSADMTVSPTTGASAAVLGVAMMDCKAGEPIAVECEGLFKLTAAGTIAAGARVESAANGKVASGTENTIGVALNAASADGDVCVKFSI
jgi:predicted RecA/RadA family phage recombinase